MESPDKSKIVQKANTVKDVEKINTSWEDLGKSSNEEGPDFPLV